MSEATQSSSTQAQPSITPLVRHTKKTEWGRALLLWRREEKRAYQFEDGNMRVFAESFCNLLQPAMQPDPVLRQKLRQRAVADGHVATTAKGGAKGQGLPKPTVADQVAVFSVLFEGGFEGDDWRDACRSRDKGKALKRHLDPAVERAQRELAKDVLRMHVEAGSPQTIIDTLVDIVGSTTLATKKQLDCIRKLDADAALAHAFIDFLHDVPGQVRGPLNQLRMALAKHDLKNVPWTVLTAARALVSPDKHLFVRPSAVREQAKLLMPSFKLTSVPTPESYARCLEMAIGVRNQLREAGLQPRDMFDVAEFMRVTLSRSNKDELLGAMAERMRASSKPVH